MLLRPGSGRTYFDGGSIHEQDKNIEDYTIEDWQSILSQGEPTFTRGTKVRVNPTYDDYGNITTPGYYETTGNYWTETDIGYEQDITQYRSDQQLYEAAEYQVESYERNQAYLKSLEELAALEARSKQLEALNKAGIRASRYGSGNQLGGRGGVGSHATTMLQEIDTSQGDLLK